jgi:hypothetical protein
MTSCKGNVVEAVLKRISACEEHQAVLKHLHGDVEQVRERALDMLQDIEQELCKLAAEFVTAPISGRIFTPLPHEHLSEQQSSESLHVQMQLP